MTANFLPIGITILEAAAQRILPAILFQQRNIGGFIADVTLEEDHTDEVVITEHPVERGAAISDHAYKRPATVVVQVGYSNSSLRALANPFYVQLVYNQFLALQASLQPFSITTGKRIYSNMLIRRLSVKTDEKSENALYASIECQEVLIATTQTVSAQADPSKMASPAANGGTSERGVAIIRPASPELRAAMGSPG